jgi:threonine dehydratase
MNPTELTPVESYNQIYYKRDDLYKPFDIPLNGGKIRQCQCLVSDNLDLIRSEYNSHIVTATNVDSPQGLIVANVAKQFNLKCSVFYGNVSEKTLTESKIINGIRDTGAEVRSIAKIGYDAVLYKRMTEMQKQTNFFIIKFGINLENSTSIIDCISDQVENIPDNLKNLLIPTGSGIMAGAILQGVRKYNKKIENIYVVQIAGYDRTEKINSISLFSNYIYIKDKTYPYNRKVTEKITDSFELDNIYEAKAHKYMKLNINTGENDTLFWVVGNANYIRG